MEEKKTKKEDKNNIKIREISSNFKKAMKMTPMCRKKKKSVLFLEPPKEFKLNNIKKTEISMKPKLLEQKIQSDILHSKTKKSKSKTKTDKNSTLSYLPPIKTKVVNINKHYFIPIITKFDPSKFMENVKKRSSYERIKTMENNKRIYYFNNNNKFQSAVTKKRKLTKTRSLNKSEIFNNSGTENGKEREKKREDKIKYNNNKENEIRKDEIEDKKSDNNENIEIKIERKKSDKKRISRENSSKIINNEINNDEKNNEDNMTNNKIIIHNHNKSADSGKKKYYNVFKKILCCFY